MNRWWYAWVVQHKLLAWIKDPFTLQKRDVHLVQDHERCLWTDEAKTALPRRFQTRARNERPGHCWVLVLVFVVWPGNHDPHNK